MLNKAIDILKARIEEYKAENSDPTFIQGLQVAMDTLMTEQERVLEDMYQEQLSKL
jgi:hypothetical protein